VTDEAELFDNEDDDEEDWQFVPEPWDIAMTFGVGGDPEADRAALDELADAMLMWARGPELEELTTRSIAAVWSEELEGQIRSGLRAAAELGDDWRPSVEAATAAFEQDPKGSPVTRAAVQRLAWDLGSQDASPFFCLCCIDERVAHASPGCRRARAREAAILAVRDVAVSAGEVAAAVAATAPGRLATDERRRAVRRRLGRLARHGRRSLPALACELERIASEPLPADPALDDVWEVVAHALLGDHAKPELN